MSSPTTSTVVSTPVSGKAIRRPVRNWLETSPRTLTTPPGRQLARLDLQGRIAVVTEIGDVGAQLAQAIHQVADGALVHALDAAQGVIATGQGQGGGQRPKGGARRSPGTDPPP